MTSPRRGWSSGDSEPEKVWIPVRVPTPVFNGVDEMHRYEDAIATLKRCEGKSLADFMERVVVEAQATREPGEDREP